MYGPWQVCLDEGTSCYYYWNTQTNEVQWHPPVQEPPVQEPPVPEVQSVQERAGNPEDVQATSSPDCQEAKAHEGSQSGKSIFSSFCIVQPSHTENLLSSQNIYITLNYPPNHSILLPLRCIEQQQTITTCFSLYELLLLCWWFSSDIVYGNEFAYIKMMEILFWV